MPAGRPLVLGGGRGRVLHVLRDALHLGFGGLGEGALVGQQPRVELGEVRRQLLVDLGQLRLLRGVELGAVADEAFVLAGQQPLLLGVEAERVALVVERLDPLEELRVERDLVERRRQLGRPFLVERLIGGRRHIVGHHREHRQHPAEPLAGLLARLDGVGEGRRGRIVGDRRDTRALLVDAELDRFGEQLGLDLVPRRNAVVRPGPVGQQDVVRDRDASAAVDADVARVGCAGAAVA